MPNNPEDFARAVYKKWRADNRSPEEGHPDEENMACFLEGKLSREESDRIKRHFLACDTCSENLAILLKLKETQDLAVPQELIAAAKELVIIKEKISPLEILLTVKGNLLELLSTTGDILVGQELVPAPVLRSRQIKDFKDEITILKDFQDIRVEARIENKAGRYFDLRVIIKEKQTAKLIKDLRVTLMKADVELESYLADSGKVTFEHVLFGKYTVVLTDIDDKLASILLEIKT